MPDRPRIRDVAELAGVSPSTVSVVLNSVQSARVKESTRTRIEEAAKALGYIPNGLARDLRTRSSKTIALVSDVIATTPYAGQLIQGAQEAAWRAGYLLMLVNTGGDEALEELAIRALRQQQVGGVLYATMFHRVLDLPQSLAGLPVVLLDARSNSPDVPSIIPDEINGAHGAMTELISEGHTRIAFIFDQNDGAAVSGRLAGYQSALAEHGIPFDRSLLTRETSNSAGGRRAALKVLGMPNPPTAIFAFNDQMAIGVYRAAHESGLLIPEGLSVIGFDNLAVISAELTPGLTTVALPHYEMGEAAAQRLLQLMDGTRETEAFENIEMIPCPLVRRGSVGPKR